MEEKFKTLTDEELVLIWDNDEAKNALYCRMLPSLHKLVAQFSERGISGYDYDDLLQEASLAFARAVTTYKSDKQASFRTYLWVCVRSHMLNLARHSASASERSTAGSVSIYDPINSENPEIRFIDTLATESDFEENVMREQLTDMLLSMAKGFLSTFEYKVFDLFYIQHRSIAEIALKQGCDVKSVGNTLYRIRIKFKNRKSQL